MGKVDYFRSTGEPYSVAVSRRTGHQVNLKQQESARATALHFQVQDDTKRFKAGEKVQVFHMSQILTQEELIAEGRRQSNCLASYHDSLRKDKRSWIWCLREYNVVVPDDGRHVNIGAGTKPTSVFTVEVNKRVVRQARTFDNAMPTMADQHLLAWIQLNGYGVMSM